MSESTIERVARAIDPTAAKVADMLLNKGLKHKDVLTILPMDKARAAIDAMRDLTPAMADASFKRMEMRRCHTPELAREVFADGWAAAIDAALNQQEAG